MDFNTTIRVNKQIMALIKSKYSENFPLAYHNADAVYYGRLAAEVLKTEAFHATVRGPAQAAHEEVVQGAGARQ